MHRYILIWIIAAGYLVLPCHVYGSDHEVISKCIRASTATGLCLGGLAGLSYANSLQQKSPRMCADVHCQISSPLLLGIMMGTVGANLGYLVGHGVVLARRCVRYVTSREDPALSVGLALIAKQDALAANAFCPICIDDASEAPSIPFVMAIQCGHAFHKNCIKEWRQLKHNTCPTCRGAIDPSLQAEPEAVEGFLQG